MKKPFKVLHGIRVIIPFPKVEEQTDSGIILTPAAQEQKIQDELNNFLKVKVIQVGTDCTIVKEGDLVYVPARCVQPGRADMLTLENGDAYLSISERDVLGTW